MSVHSVLELIPQFSAECGDSSGVPMELPVKAGLAILQVGHRRTNFNQVSSNWMFVFLFCGCVGEKVLILIKHFN